MSKFLIPYSFSILSLFVSVMVLQLYDRMERFNEETSTILGNLIQATSQMGVLTLYFGAPIILGGCLLGELLFRFIILPFKLSYIISLLVYLLLAFSIVFIFCFLTIGIPTVYEDSRTFQVMCLMGLTMICAVTFFVSRNIWEKK
ncbi:hypothetical protein CN285_09330 [Bacillus cereus]|uniref:hypothetical protein n=1 Tax=Bacillus TaxID=1386 RepID=UPI0006541B59|nr:MULTISPECIES: hypothetical protein [Bacillus]KMN47005.1 hypothetical protein VK90_01410 [Bacillus sp. LK2]PFD42289.1 hypothetical protein CN285_09330 [Bacillus cereus]PGM66056.1 hypothetical protein CN947_02715 [Bacillus cereus]